MRKRTALGFENAFELVEMASAEGLYACQRRGSVTTDSSPGGAPGRARIPLVGSMVSQSRVALAVGKHAVRSKLIAQFDG